MNEAKTLLYQVQIQMSDVSFEQYYDESVLSLKTANQHYPANDTEVQ